MEKNEITNTKNKSISKDNKERKRRYRKSSKDRSNSKRFIKNEKLEELRIKRNQLREERDNNLIVHKEKILMVKAKVDAREFQILKSLIRFNYDVEKTVEDLTEFHKKKLDKNEKKLTRDTELFNLHFPGEQFDIVKFREIKKDLNHKRKEERLAKKQENSSGKEKNYYKEKYGKKYSKEKNYSNESLEEKQKRKEERLAKKEEKLSEKKEKNFYKEKYGNKNSKEKEKKINKESVEEKQKRIAEIKSKIQSKEVNFLYLDGNNMLFVDNSIRKDCLNKKRQDGELKLSNLTFEFMKRTNTKGCLVFDNTSQVFNKESEGVFLKVTSAYPEFESSDDAFKVWAGGLDATKLKSSLFVTSDRELKERLLEKGVGLVLKSGEFFDLLKETLNEEYEKILN